MGGETTSADDLAAVLDVVHSEPPGTPLTTREVAEVLSWSRRTAYDKLETLADRGDLATKKVGARGRVWWRPVDGTGERESSTEESLPASTDAEPRAHIGTLEASTRALQDSDDRAEIGEAVVAALADVAGVADVLVYRFDTSENRLVPVAASVGPSDGVDHAPIAAAEDAPIWTSFVEDEACIVAPTAETVLPGSGEAARFELVVPLGDHGVVVAATEERAGIDGVRTGVELVASMATTAFDRVEHRTTLRDLRERLADREGRLQRVTRTNEVVRAVDRALVEATTLAEIQSAVPAALTEGDRYRFAWIGTVADADGTLEPRARSGDASGYLASGWLAAADGPAEPAVEAARTGEVAVAANVADDLHGAPWRREAISRGLQSAIAVPLTHGDARYGVLAVYADRPDAFGDRERSAFGELGETIGNAMDAVATRERLLCDSVVELEFVLRDDGACFLSDLADATGGEIGFNGVVPLTEATTRLYFTVRDASAAAVTAAVEGATGVESTRIVASRGDQHFVEAVVAGRTIPSMIVEHDASIRALTVDEAGVHLTADLPSVADVRAFVERFQDEYDCAEFLARRERDRPIQTQRGFRSALADRLTERQREVLETAYYSGLYASPRRTTVGEVAEGLGVSQPTVTEHLHRAQSKLLDLVFDEDAPAE